MPDLKLTRATSTLSATVLFGASLAAAVPSQAAEVASIGGGVAFSSTQRTPAPRPAIIYDPIPYGAKRKAQMAAYSKRHYGVRSHAFGPPKQVLLHFTVTRNYPSTWRWMAANSASPGNVGTKKEKPGACTHFVIGKNGTIYQLAPLNLMCRHVVGLNHQAVGIEFVEMKSSQNILNRTRQRIAGQNLVRWLQSEYAISKANVIGHAMANSSPYFFDRLGWYNDHADWPTRHVKAFRQGILE